MDDEFDQRVLLDPPVAPSPWYFRLGHFLSKRRIRGGDRLLAEARRRGLLDRLVVYSLSPEVTLRVPLWRPCNQWDQDDVRAYEGDLVCALSDAIARMPGHVTLVDCGADIGTVSAHLVARCKNISAVVAFEPNQAAHRVLVENLRALRVASDARRAAVANFEGRGVLVTPSDDPSAHAMYIVRRDDGDIAVQRIDDLALGDGSCVIKIDVEGMEAAVVQGAARTIERASEVLIAFEAHPRVSRRTGHDPSEVMRVLLALRAFTFETDVGPARAITADVPFFDQVRPDRVYNVIARARAA